LPAENLGMDFLVVVGVVLVVDETVDEPVTTIAEGIPSVAGSRPRSGASRPQPAPAAVSAAVSRTALTRVERDTRTTVATDPTP